MKNNFWIYAGITAFCLALGLLVGASNSPVAGVTITAVFGIVLAILGLKKDAQNTSLLNVLDISTVGKILVLFSISLLLGIYLGVSYRTYPVKSAHPLIWQSDEEAPPTSFEAIDWILTKEILLEKGYSEADVRSLYEIRLRQIADSTNTYDSYSDTNPMSKLLRGTETKSTGGRGPASDP